MLTKIEIELVERYLNIHELYVDEPTFYSALLKIVPRWRAEKLYDANAYKEYLSELAEEVL